MAAAYVSGDYMLQAIAAYFGVHSGTVSRTVRRAEGQQPAYHHFMPARPDPIFVF
jgi:IS30 family transposase